MSVDAHAPEPGPYECRRCGRRFWHWAMRCTGALIIDPMTDTARDEHEPEPVRCAR